MDGGSAIMANDHPERRDKQEGYQIFVRIPYDRDGSVEEIQEFLEYFAELVSCDEKNIKVLLHEDYGDGGGGGGGDDGVHDGVDDGVDVRDHGDAPEDLASAQVESTETDLGAIVQKKATRKDKPAGGRSSPLYPAYVCHNKL
jgi:hypothetical protein